MSWLADASIVVSLIVAAGALAMTILRRGSAALRHWVIAAALLAAAFAPLLRPIAPAWSVGGAPHSTRSLAEPPALASLAGPGISGTVAETPEPADSSHLAAERPLDVTPWLLRAWIAGVSIALVILLTGLARLSLFAARAASPADPEAARMVAELARLLGLSRDVTLVEARHPHLPMTWGFARPMIILPVEARGWHPDRLRVVLLHELAHIQRHDWLTQIAAEMLRCLYWFHPLLWLAARRLRQESEQACDDVVLNEGVEAADYASHLLELARSAAAQHRANQLLPALQMARPSSLERRFTAMLNHKINRVAPTFRTRSAVAAAAVLVALFSAGYGAAQGFYTFSGSVFDATNRVVPGVTLALVNAQSEAKYEVKSDAAGHFAFVGLPPGSYTWKASLMGFETLNGSVDVARSVTKDLSLRVGALEETITVSGAGQSGASEPGPSASRSPNVERIRARRSARPCEAGATGGVIQAPTKIADTVPQYPANLKSTGVGALVVLDILVNTTGDVTNASVAGAPNPEFDAAAMEAVRHWQYTPTVLNCTQVEMRMRVTVRFVS